MDRKTQEQLIDELLKDYSGPESFWGESGLYAQLKKKIIERTLNAEMDHHLGYTKHDPKGHNSGNSRNGSYSKTLTTVTGPVTVEVPRDRKAEFEPVIVPKGRRRLAQVGRHDPVPVRPRYDHPRHYRPPEGGLRQRGVPGPHIEDHRCGHG